jgi:hypothetical protein
MTERDCCPVCAKPVASSSALAAHLEFAHDVSDPDGYLAALDQPPKVRRRPVPGRRSILAASAVVAVGALLAGAVTLLSGGEDETALAAGTSASTTTPKPPTTAAPPTAVPATVAETTTTEPPATTAPTTTSPPTTTSAPPEEPASGPFRRPFVTDARVKSCTLDGGVYVYEIALTLSGSRNIVLGGELLPGSSGDGDQTIEHEVPSGTTGYLDHVDVADAAGNSHELDILPALHLPGC